MIANKPGNRKKDLQFCCTSSTRFPVQSDNFTFRVVGLSEIRANLNPKGTSHGGS